MLKLVLNENNLNELEEATSQKVKEHRRKSYRREAMIEQYIPEIIDNIKNHIEQNEITIQAANSKALRCELLKIALNGADSWSHYSWGGSSLCYDGEIEELIIAPSQRTKSGYYKGFHLLDLQANLLYNSFSAIWDTLYYSLHLAIAE